MSTTGTQRSFARNLPGVGTAAETRTHVSQIVKETSQQAKSNPVEPVDYETYILQQKTTIHNDKLRNLLLFPEDSLSVSTLKRDLRTEESSVPPRAEAVVSNLLSKECVASYKSNWTVVKNKYEKYSGSYIQLIADDKRPPPQLKEQVFESDIEDREEDNLASQKGSSAVTKQGWLLKGPESGNDSSSSFISKSYKKRYFYLKCETDRTYVLEFHKDDKKSEAKGSIFLDSLTAVLPSKRGKNTFELKMNDDKYYILATESESEQREWIQTLKNVLNPDSISQKSSRADEDSISMNGDGDFDTHTLSGGSKDITRYTAETDKSLSMKRKANRAPIFHVYQQLPKSQSSRDRQPEFSAFQEKFPNRFTVSLSKLKFKLQANVAEHLNKEKQDNPEPFFLTIALYDAREGRKVTENVYLDCNSDMVFSMVEAGPSGSNGISESNNQSGKTSQTKNKLWMYKPGTLLFSTVSLHPELYLVLFVDKVLQGPIGSAIDPYLKGIDPRTASKQHKLMRQYCQNIGQYRMPFAWAARPVCRSSGHVDQMAGMIPVYKHEGKNSEEDLLKHLTDFSKPDKVSKWVTVPATLQLNVELHDERKLGQGVLTPSLDLVRPFPASPSALPVLEVQHFHDGRVQTTEPHLVYRNNLYIYPLSVKFDNAKNVKARNISCQIEVRDSDDEKAAPLECIYARPRCPDLTTARCAVIHHNTSPEFMDEIKVRLPPALTERHHILVRFYHVSCESVKSDRRSSRGSFDNAIGYAWLPLLHSERFVGDEHILPVASCLPAGYLSHESQTRPSADVKWLDGGKGIFRIRLKLLSSIYTNDKHLHDFFAASEKVRSNPTDPNETDAKNMLKAAINGSSADPKQKNSIKAAINGYKPYEPELRNAIKGLYAADLTTLIHFLPTVLNQLFSMLPSTSNQDIAYEAVRVVTHVVNELCQLNKDALLRSYINFAFDSTQLSRGRQKTIHEELARNLNMLLMAKTSTSGFDVTRKFLKNSWFFFDLITKSVSQYLLATNIIKRARPERFIATKDSNFVNILETFIGMTIGHIFNGYIESPTESRNANHALATFIKNMFTSMDRGFVFQLVNTYMEKFRPGDPKVLHQFKFEFIEIVCSHEFYVQLCLPTLRAGYARNRDAQQDFTLTEKYRQMHFLSGLLLQELKSGLNEIREVRKLAITTLRNQLAKHAFDDRYDPVQRPAHISRVISLYLPLFNILLENKNRLVPRETSRKHTHISNRNSLLLSDAGDLVTPAEGPMTSSKSGSLPNYASHSSRVSLASDSAASSLQPAKDGNILAMIAGHSPAGNKSPRVGIGGSQVKGSELDLVGSRASFGSDDSTSTIDARDSVSLTGTANASNSTKVPSVRFDKLDPSEVKDLLVSFLYIIKNIPDDILIQWMSNCTESEISDFFSLLEICLNQFKYLGKRRFANMRFISHGDSLSSKMGGAKTSVTKQTSDSAISGLGSRKPSSSVPTRRGGEQITKYMRQQTASTLIEFDENATKFPEQWLMEGCLVAEAGMIILDTLALYTQNPTFKRQLVLHNGENELMYKVFELHLSFLERNQSEQSLEHCFALIRMFITKFDDVLFRGKASFCGSLCYNLLRCSNSHLPSVRMEACITLYFLMKANYRKNEKPNFTRVKLQMMKSVSKLINDNYRVAGARFKGSLATVNSYASKDKSMRNTTLVTEVNGLTKSIRSILMATDKMKEHEHDPEKSIDLKYALACEYINSPELRTTWLESMAENHAARRDYSEAAHCYLHMAGAVAEFLKQKQHKGPGGIQKGCQILSELSGNIATDEKNFIDDRAVIEELQYTEDSLVERLEKAADYLCQAERYEALGSLYRIVIPIYEKHRHLQSLSECYGKLHEAYSKAVEFSKSGKRILGSYFRVGFFGSGFEDDDGKEYVYKEHKLTTLPEICDRLKKLYGEKYGDVKIIQESKQVNPKELDPHQSHIQVTFVQPYFTKEQLLSRVTDYERNDRVDQFVYATPFTQGGRAHGSITEQWTRKTILSTKQVFPYVKKRIEVLKRVHKEFSPIEVAIEEMRHKVKELETVVNSEIPDMRGLQLKLQGAVSAQVNAGPIAYAEAFLAPGASAKLKLQPRHVSELKEVFREFITVCPNALELNYRLIAQDQMKYHESLQAGFQAMHDKLQEMLVEKPDSRPPSVSRSSGQLLTEMMNEWDQRNQQQAVQFDHSFGDSNV